ncbi:aminodeoxychorismate synthase component I [Candidatus Nephthysia bennettiae]|uniref:Aminodeoxychorismate synthase component I n=1 Tax=Candidatus Nephthysia bennettiae TaxID=3127016 RepID=A0A934N190_9BACT|nr:aminodeoxychorismate synthase component I [Candidatus Dormibacteraeota bacterium]MBJ7613086.1 aminodeoxychorismate synthase component I [Candidatus Dormibacteraeota bacterium]
MPPADACFGRRPLAIQLTPFEVGAAVAGDERPVVLVGSWAGGGAVVASQPLIRLPSGGDPFDALAEVPVIAGADGVGVGGGWFGYLGYQLGRRLERVAPPSGEVPPGSDFDLAFYDSVLRYDAAARSWWFECLWTEERAEALDQRYLQLQARLSRRSSSRVPEGFPGDFRSPGDEAHVERIERVIEHIRAGDVFQVNLCMRLEADWSGSPWAAFESAAGRLQPPYAAFLGLRESSVISLSPELFLRRRGRVVATRPIKGTSARDADPAIAEGQRRWLLSSEKNRAENVMIVDLMRNDLGRVCRTGSITVPDLAAAEAHPEIWHLVSRVRGELEPDVSDADLLRACFPPGSITGAPKIRSMQLINQLEPSPRIVYTGAIGYASPLAGLELSVAIRTFEIRDGTIGLGVGGGIVADSDPRSELAECYQKAAALIAALGAGVEAAAP